MKKHIIGIVTIGQSPRIDITEDIEKYLNPNIQLLERGAMDNFTLSQIEQKFFPEDDDTVLVSRMRDGAQAKMSESKIMPYIQQAISSLVNEGAQAVILMCTGKFPDFNCEVPFITPYDLLHGVVKSMYKNAKIGIVTPDPDQIKQATNWWVDDGFQAKAVSLSPYIKGDLQKAISQLQLYNPDIVVLDCLGYTTTMKQQVIDFMPKATILPRTLIVRILNELFDV